MKIRYFTPPQLIISPYKFKDLLNELGDDWHFAYKGRYCLYHILKALKIKGPCLVPVYCCSSVLEPLNQLGIPFIFYDIREDDLNPDLTSIRDCIKKYQPDSLLSISMYGNPAELDILEDVCRTNNIKLIDDAAQSFGALVNNKHCGYFGDAGFFSFSPGKPMAGHLGGCFRVNENYTIKYRKHTLLHKLILKDYIENRCKKSIKNRSGLSLLVVRIISILHNILNVKDGGVSKFEEGILYGIYNNSMLIYTPYRTELADRLAKEIGDNSKFKILKPYNDDYRKGIAHKYVLIANSKAEATRLNEYLHNNEIESQMGYNLLSDDLSNLPHARSIDGRIVEIPLDPDINAFEYISEVLKSYIN